MIDQILLWNTSANGTVDLVSSREQLKKKVIRSSILGGQIVVRPAELFEDGDERSEGNLFLDATDEKNGFLYHLMKNGLATLDLYDMSIFERAELRFQQEGLIDRGRKILKKSEFEKVRKRTLDRAQIIDRLGWKPSNIKGQGYIDQNVFFRQNLKKIGLLYFKEKFDETKMASFLRSSKDVVFRSQLYDHFTNDWIKDLNTSQNPETFVKDLKQAVTISTIQARSSNYGSRVSSVEFDVIPKFTYTTEFKNNRFNNLESIIFDGFINSIDDSLTKKDQLDSSLVQSIKSFDAQKFVDRLLKNSDDIKRSDLDELIYGNSAKLGTSLAILFDTDKELITRPHEQKKVIEERINELDNETRKRITKQRNLIKWSALGLGELVVFLVGGPPLVGTILGEGVDKVTKMVKPDRDIFKGFK